MSREHVETIIGRLSEATGVSFHLDEDNFCLLRLDDRIDLSLEYQPAGDCLVVTADCGALPSPASSALLQELLDANFCWAATGGCTLSTNSRVNMVYLQYREAAAAIDEARLEAILQAVLDNAELWRERIATSAAVDAAADEGEPQQRQHSDQPAEHVQPGHVSMDQAIRDFVHGGAIAI